MARINDRLFEDRLRTYPSITRARLASTLKKESSKSLRNLAAVTDTLSATGMAETGIVYSGTKDIATTVNTGVENSQAQMDIDIDGAFSADVRFQISMGLFNSPRLTQRLACSTGAPTKPKWRSTGVATCCVSRPMRLSTTG